MNDDHQPHRGSAPPAADNPLGTRRAPVTPEIDTVFELLADVDRRRICLYLMRSDQTVVTVDDLVEILADEDDDQERLAIDLHHRHLPKLADAGIVEYDARSNTTRYWGQPTVEKWAEHVQSIDEQNRSSRSAP
ncbi:hypothetical protein ACFR9U_07640 [Halorientalis brevis]|uniref:DUF7344 domain-containing protein n=1 Tax=Halorientalis brevis TaxID=1126241 RepID=A0ABD6C9K3_9EURY